MFENQVDNIDRSGHGDKEIFLRNLKRHGCDLSRIKTITKNSLNLTKALIVSDCGDLVRIFSIDGGHTADITQNDLTLASETICVGGLVVLDDFFNEAWPGVADGASKYLHNTENLIPVAIVGNKFIFTNTKEMATRYIEELHKIPAWNTKRSTVFGKEVVVISAQTKSLRNYLANTYIWNTISEKPLGRAIKQRIVRWL